MFSGDGGAERSALSRRWRLGWGWSGVALILAVMAAGLPATPSRAGLAAVGVDDTLSTRHDRAATVPAPGVLGNDVNMLGSTTAILLSGTSHGALMLDPDGGYTYIPAAGYLGTDTFRYRPSGFLSSPATVTITVTNAAPMAIADHYAMGGGTLTVAPPGVLSNDFDADGDSLTAALVTGVGHGTLSLTSGGALTYKPTAGFVGQDGFTYRTWDGLAWSVAAQASIDVQPPAATPTPSPTFRPSPSPPPSGPPPHPPGPSFLPLPTPSIGIPYVPMPLSPGASSPPLLIGVSAPSARPAASGEADSGGLPAPSGGPAAGTPAAGQSRDPGDPGGTPRSSSGAPGTLAMQLGGGLHLGVGSLAVAPLWLIPAAAVAGPGLLVLLWLLIQISAGIFWLPATRRVRGEERRRRRQAVQSA